MALAGQGLRSNRKNEGKIIASILWSAQKPILNLYSPILKPILNLLSPILNLYYEIAHITCEIFQTFACLFGGKYWGPKLQWGQN